VRTVDSLYKLKIFIQIAMLYLEDDDPVSAETFIKKASSLIAGSKDPELELQYKTSYARIMDAKRRWAAEDHGGRQGAVQPRG
jgi:COP9 signalosome complex subunit 4